MSLSVCGIPDFSKHRFIILDCWPFYQHIRFQYDGIDVSFDFFPLWENSCNVWRLLCKNSEGFIHQIHTFFNMIVYSMFSSSSNMQSSNILCTLWGMGNSTTSNIPFYNRNWNWIEKKWQNRKARTVKHSFICWCNWLSSCQYYQWESWMLDISLFRNSQRFFLLALFNCYYDPRIEFLK